MAIKSIPCGGFFYDDESVSFEKDEYGRYVMSAAGGGSGYDAVILSDNIDGDILALQTGDFNAIKEKMVSGQPVSGVFVKKAMGSGANLQYSSVPIIFDYTTADNTIGCTIGSGSVLYIKSDNTVAWTK